MRDLAADLAEFNHWMSDNYDTYDPTLMWFSRVLPEAITRAIKAEAEVERLQAETARLRKVVDAARKMFNVTTDHDYQQAVLGLLAELDEEGE
jgi:hypothetical protein